MDYFKYSSSGEISYTKDGWLMLMIDHDIVEYYSKLCEYWGIVFNKRGKTAPHITVCKDKFMEYPEYIGDYIGKIYEFTYTDQVRINETHVWLDVYSEQLAEIRSKLTSYKLDQSFHITLGRF